MKVEIIRDTVAGKKSVFVGDVVELSEREAQELIQMKKATPYVAPAASAPASPKLEQEFVETADLPTAEIETTVKRAKRKE